MANSNRFPPVPGRPAGAEAQPVPARDVNAEKGERASEARGPVRTKLRVPATRMDDDVEPVTTVPPASPDTPVVRVAPLPPVREIAVSVARPLPRRPAPPPGLVAYAITRSDGVVRASAGPDAKAMAAQAAHFRRLAELLGEELGLEGLGAMTVSGTERRMVSVDRARAGHAGAAAGEVLQAIVLPAFDPAHLATLESDETGGAGRGDLR